jgi:hypothetical protein
MAGFTISEVQYLESIICVYYKPVLWEAKTIVDIFNVTRIANQ